MYFYYIIPIIMIIGLFLLFNWLMGYKKGNIIIDLDDRYINYSEYISAIQKKLESEGKDVEYKGDRRFIIDGKKYMFIERNVSMGGVPLQRTILQPEK
ncbi:hypothetical protein SAMN04487943_101150 [Gracilibacillus orientalis]|uniref:Uncharacterized protein n=1 Tax=Gracilibacillus orientalis TaxID=334253 RepID=A0A1I4H3J0_9BACI|nr:hypothetical protein [Gracilibacillus orientalis]SFL35951.1 hypothetical protein SAMN04487943_101150 [Gracilibacillus orientalis]